MQSTESKANLATQRLGWLRLLVVLLAAVPHSADAANITCELCENENFQVEIDACYVTKVISLQKDEPLNFTASGSMMLSNVTAVLFTPSGQLQSNITEIPKDVFRVFPQLRKLEIRGTIQHLDSDDFVDAHNLRHLTLNNQLECITSRTFAHAMNLSTLTLSRNRINRIEDYAFEGLQELGQLTLLKNQLTTLTRHTFVGLQRLNYLNLRDNNIETIEDGTFDLPQLSELILSKNRIRQFSDDIFHGAPLQRLTVDNNALETIGKSMYRLFSVNRIIMYQNKIRDIDIIEFSKLPELTALWLRDSGFRFGNKSLVHYQPTASKLNYLDISANHLAGAEDLQKLQLFPQLKTLTIDDNEYVAFESCNRSIHEIFPELETLHLSRNRWNCTWLKPVLEQTRADSIRTVIGSDCE